MPISRIPVSRGPSCSYLKSVETNTTDESCVSKLLPISDAAWYFGKVFADRIFPPKVELTERYSSDNGSAKMDCCSGNRESCAAL
jgi:hypothetical protein